MSVATNRQWTTKDGQKKEAVEFHNVVLWGKQAEIAASFLTKGSLVLVEGRIETRSWDDKDGNPRRTTEIIAENIQLGPKPGDKPSAHVRAEPVAAEETLPALDLDGNEEDTGRDLEQLF
jgi:single-strand DNA-binding protein